LRIGRKCAVLGLAALAAIPALGQSSRPGRTPLVPVRPAVDERSGPAFADDTQREESPLERALKHAEKSREVLKDVKDYTALFTKREVVSGRLTKQVMAMKCREKPFSVYFLYRGGPEAGREVLYVHGGNGGRLLVHETGIKAIAGTVPLPPTDPQVMAENRYPITRVGISNLLETIITQWQTEARYGEPEVKFYPNAKLGEQACLAIETTNSRPRKEFRFFMTRLYLDKETYMPVRVEQYGWPRAPQEKPPLVEEYTYTSVKTNVGLTDIDFDTRNPNYGY
jgi:hypothetical protein